MLFRSFIPALAGFQSMPRWLIPPVSVIMKLIMKLTAGGSLLDRNFAIPWAPGPPGLPQICFVRNLTPGTKKSDHDFGFKSRAKEPPWNRKCCRLLVAEICENFLRSTPDVPVGRAIYSCAFPAWFTPFPRPDTPRGLF